MKWIPLTCFKWYQTMKVSWSELFVYRVNFLLMVIGPMLVFFFIKYNLWSSIYESAEQSIIQGYSLQEMLAYHLWFLIVSILAMAYNSGNLAEEIRLGQITSYLIYPFSLWEHHAARYMSLQCIQVGTALLTLAVAYWGIGRFAEETMLQNFEALVFLQGVGISLLVGIFWFNVQYMMGLLAFWLEETWTFRVLFQIAAQFLSGAIIPLDFYPPWLVQLLDYSPFPFLAYVPVKIFLGDYTGTLKAAGILLFWILVSSAIVAWIWKRGLKHYTAAGI